MKDFIKVEVMSKRRRMGVTFKVRQSIHPLFLFELFGFNMRRHKILRLMIDARSCFPMQDSLGYVEIKLADVVENEHINERYHLIDSKDGVLHLDIRWKVI